MVTDPIQEVLLALVAEKEKSLKPRKSTGRKEHAAPASNVVNIMDALRKSVEQDMKSRKAG